MTGIRISAARPGAPSRGTMGYIDVREPGLYAECQKRAEQLYRSGRSLFDIRADLNIHPQTLRRMLGLPTAGDAANASPHPGGGAVNYAKCDRRWRERVEHIGPVRFDSGPTADCGRAPLIETHVPRGCV